MSKHKGAVYFDSALGLRLFKTARLLARLSLICGIISGLLFMGRDIDLPEPTLAEATPTIAFFGFWLLLKIAMNLWIRKCIRTSAASRGQTVRQYRRETSGNKLSFELSEKGKYPNTKRGQERRAKDALDYHWRLLGRRLEQVPKERRLDGTKEDSERSFKRLRATQEKGQSIVDQACNEYAVREYAALNGAQNREVRDMLREENGRGPVTKAVNALYDSVHFEHEAYFENHEHSFRGAFKGYSEIQGVDGSKKKIYNRY